MEFLELKSIKTEIEKKITTWTQCLNWPRRINQLRLSSLRSRMKKMSKNKQSIRDLQENINHTKIYIIKVIEERIEKKRGKKR